MVSMPAAADVGPPMGTSVVWGFSQAGGAIRPSVQLLADRNLAFSTLKTYAAALSSSQEAFGSRTVFSYPLMKHFLSGVQRHQPVLHSLSPQWDLVLVLQTLFKAPFVPLGLVLLKFRSAQMALFLAPTSAKRVSDISAVSVALSCLRIQGVDSSAILCPNMAFTPRRIPPSYQE